MAKVKLGLRTDAPVEAKQKKIDTLAVNLAGNAPFAAIQPTPAALQAFSAVITAKQREITAAEAGLAALKAEWSALGDQAHAQLLAVAAAVQNVSLGRRGPYRQHRL